VLAEKRETSRLSPDSPDSPDSNLMNPEANGSEPDSPNNNLTQEQISALFQQYLKLHPAKSGGGAVSSIFGSGWGFWSPGPDSEGGWGVGGWVWNPGPTRGTMSGY
jgi:hypothetical protein